jgi:SAM-dependent methyltransferase
MRASLTFVAALAACGGAPSRLDDAQVKAMSRAWFEAYDRHDAAAIDRQTSHAFVGVHASGAWDRAALAGHVGKPTGKPATRTWSDESASIGPASAVYLGDVVLHGERDHEGSETLVWAREGKDWKVIAEQWRDGGLDAERARWNDVFREGVGFKTEPNALLVSAVAGRTPGTALDLATGQGRNALYLASLGWKVTAVDVSEEGLRSAREEAARRKLNVDLVDADIDKWDLGVERWDLVTMLYAGDDEQLAARVKPSLKHGGLFVLEFFARDAAAFGGQGGWKHGQLAAIFGDGFKILRDDELSDVADWGQQKDKLVRFVAEKL